MAIAVSGSGLLGLVVAFAIVAQFAALPFILLVRRHTLPMASSYSASWSGRVSRLYWLPRGGIGNGLDAPAWAPLEDVAREVLLRHPGTGPGG